MKSKKFGLLWGVLILAVFSLALVSAANECVIKTRTQCSADGGHAVLGLSGNTNAHGEVYNQNNYQSVLCCNFGGGSPNTCSGGGQTLLKLSSLTNAHAEVPSGSAYSINVCYKASGFSCRVAQVGTVCSDFGQDYSAVLSLSATTNAHLGGPNAYNIKVCCNVVGAGPSATPEAYWSDSVNGNQLNSSPNFLLGKTDLYMIIKNTGLSDGVYPFQVYEQDTISDDEIRTTKLGNAVQGTVVGGNASVLITIDQNDWNKGSTFWDFGADNSTQEYYFDVAGAPQSNVLIVTLATGPIIENCAGITKCGDYNDSTSCTIDNCTVGNTSIPGVMDCGAPGITCSCAWNAKNDLCVQSYTNSSGGGNTSIQCGNNVKENGEVCDGTDLGGKTCLTFGFVGPDTLLCNSQCDGFVTTQCLGYSCVNDGIRQIGNETCDPKAPEITDFNCTQFDNFTGGSLVCTPTCDLNMSGCIGPATGTGTCLITQNTNDTCDDGFLTFNWTGVWQAISGTNPAEQAKCEAGGVGETMPCPAQIQLPFFGIYNVAGIVVVAIIIYIIISMRNSNKTRLKRGRKR